MKLILLFVCLILGLTYLAIPEGMTGTIGFFRIMYDGLDGVHYKGEVSYLYKIRFIDWFYFVCEHLVMIILAYVILAESVKHRTALEIFLRIQVVDLIDYLITFNTGWFLLGNFIVTFNVVACLIFMLAIIYEYGGAGN